MTWTPPPDNQSPDDQLEALLSPASHGEKCRTLRQLLWSGQTVMIPGAFNAICAKTIEKLGFAAGYISGAGLHNGLVGYPDIGLLGLAEMTQASGWIARSVNIPFIADADTGFGEAIHVYRAVQAYEREGIAGIHIEDQVFPKRCGHLNGKAVIPVEQMVAKLHAAVKARQNPDFLIIARVDSKSMYGFEDTLSRARHYLNAGAEMIFPEALETPDEFQQFATELRKTHPGSGLLANMTEFGKTPMIGLQDFQAFGYNCVIYPMTAFRLMMQSIEQGLTELRDSGTQAGTLPQMTTRQDLYKLIHYSQYEALDQSLVPHQFSRSL